MLLSMNRSEGNASMHVGHPTTIGMLVPTLYFHCAQTTWWEALMEYFNYTLQGFKSADHPLGILVNNLTKCFLLSYSGVGIHKKLLPHAIGEVCSITVRLHQLVR